MEGVHVARQPAAQLVDARDERFKVVAILDAGIFSDGLQPLALQTDQIDS